MITADHQQPDVVIAQPEHPIDLVLVGDRRLTVPQQIAYAATLFQLQFGIEPSVVSLSMADAAPTLAGQMAGIRVQVLAQLPAGTA